jgi:hypothetical protein
MRIPVKFLGGVLLASFGFQSANAANVTLSSGQADFDFSYKVAFRDNSGSSVGSFSDTFDYYNLGLSVDRGGYTFGVNAAGLLEKDVAEYVDGTFDGNYGVDRSSYSFSVSKRISDSLTLSSGYYTAEVAVGPGSEDESQDDDTIETEALFASLTYSARLNDTMFWYGRVGAQLNQADLTVNANDGLLTATLDGNAYLLGAGIFYPLSDTTGLTFGAEFKEFNYDGGRWDLSEEQTLFTAGYNFQF